VICSVRRHPAVESDILDIAAWIAHDSKLGAFRFLDAVEASIGNLRLMPTQGSPKHLRPPRLRSVRSWAIEGFPNHLILYDIKADHLYILAVIYGGRSYSRLLAERS